MIVFRKTMEAAVEAERQRSWQSVREICAQYGDALRRVSALQIEMSAWVMNKAGNITPEQAAQMFYAQDDSWQAAFFNVMQAQAQAHHDAMPEGRPGGMPKPGAGVPAGEAQWYYMADKLTAEGFETIEAMFEHAKAARERQKDLA